MKRAVLFFMMMSVIFSASLFAGGQQEAEADNSVKNISFSVNVTPILPLEFWSIVADRYMEQNPDVKIELVGQPSSNIQHRDFVKTLLSTGQFPDITVMTSPGDFVSAGALKPLPVWELDYMADTSTGKIEGESYVAVYKTQVGGMWYNRTAFQELGLEEPSSYAELISICETISKTDYIPITMGLKDGWPQLVLASMILSADILAEDPDWGLKRNNNEVSFSDPNVVKALEKYKTLTTQYANSDMSSVSYSQMLEYFFTGKALMLPMGSWVQGEEAKLNPDFEVGFFPIPSDSNADSISVWANEGLSISAETEHPEVCLDFLRFFMTDQEWYAQFLETEMLFPTTKDAVDYPMSDLRLEVGEKYSILNKVEHWYDMTGDAALLPGLQSFFNKMTSKIAMGADVKAELELFDREWDLANAQR
ncbi:MAG: extracellular solute-binding protein [Spirochaetales bacterium]|nr:extracellular solute-binding protein [Spirochaetales bacterium]